MEILKLISGDPRGEGKLEDYAFEKTDLEGEDALSARSFFARTDCCYFVCFGCRSVCSDCCSVCFGCRSVCFGCCFGFA